MNDQATSTRMPTAGEEVILEDRACNNCGYNLKGLVRGGSCPECGEEIRVVRRTMDDRLGDAPRDYLASLSIGFVLTGVAVLILLLGVLTMIVSTGASGIGDSFRRLVFPLGGVFYATGVFLVCRPRPARGGAGPRMERGKPEWATLRLISRVSAIAMAFGLTAHTVARISGQDWISWIALPCALAGLIGAIPVTIQLGNLAHWASDSHIANHVQGAGFFIAVCGGLSALLFTDLALIVGLLAIPLIMLFSGALFWMGWQTLRMQSMVSWAIRNEKHRIARDARLAERAKQQAQEAATRSGFTGAPDEADPHLLQTIERQNAAANAESGIHEGREETEIPRDQTYLGHKLDASGADSYDLEDD